MHTKQIWANLAVSNLDCTTEFYTLLGFKPNRQSKDLTSFLFGDNNFIIHFFLKDVLETNMNVKIADTKNAIEIMFTLSAESTDQVNEWAKAVEKAGGKLISNPEAFGEGYYGFVFADPDGHTFNVFYM